MKCPICHVDLNLSPERYQTPKERLKVMNHIKSCNKLCPVCNQPMKKIFKKVFDGWMCEHPKYSRVDLKTKRGN